jgi:hypothetical protein
MKYTHALTLKGSRLGIVKTCIADILSTEIEGCPCIIHGRGKFRKLVDKNAEKEIAQLFSKVRRSWGSHIRLADVKTLAECRSS